MSGPRGVLIALFLLGTFFTAAPARATRPMFYQTAPFEPGSPPSPSTALGKPIANAGGAVTPYRGLARFHHLFGLAGGIGLSTFILSGWISMNPNRWFSSTAAPAAIRAAYAGQPPALGLAAEALSGFAGPGTRALRFVAIGGLWWIVADGGLLHLSRERGREHHAKRWRAGEPVACAPG